MSMLIHFLGYKEPMPFNYIMDNARYHSRRNGQKVYVRGTKIGERWVYRITHSPNLTAVQARWHR